MASEKDFFQLDIDFFGYNDVFGNASEGSLAPLTIKDNSPLGAPTYGYVFGSSSGELSVDMNAQNEIQILNLYQNDTLQFDIDKLTRVEWRIKMNQPTLDAASLFVIGLGSEQVNSADAMTENAWFHINGSVSTTLVVVETDDGTNNNDDEATGLTLINAYRELAIDFTLGTDDVRFFIDGAGVATGTTFDMSNYTGSLQLFAQLQKTADTNTDGFTIDRVTVRGKR